MKYNKSEKVKLKTATVNKEGGKAFNPSEKVELVLRAATTLGQTGGFYETSYASDRRFVQLIHSVSQYDPEFVLKLAWYTRKQLYLRTPATIILAEIARSGNARNVYNATRYVAETISRVDDMTELAAYCMKTNEHNRVHRGKLPMLIKRGIARAFCKFDEYQFAKYTKQDMFVTPQDVMFITHPIANCRDQMKLFAKIADDELAVPETWEDYIRINGSTTENWNYIIEKMGYMGIVRNLRTMIEKGVDVKTIVDILTDENRVKNSKMLPFRFYTAYNVISGVNSTHTGKIMGALSDAMDISAKNVHMIDGTTAVFCDNSGSMKASINPKSTVRYNDIGNLFGAILSARCSNVIVGSYGTDAVATKYINPRDSILTISQKIRDTNCGGGYTYTHKCFDVLDKFGELDVDRIIFFTDEQGYGNPSAYDRLKKFNRDHGTNPFVYTFDMKHYGTTQFPSTEPRHATIGGWSDNILQFISMFEEDRTRMTDKIDSVSISG